MKLPLNQLDQHLSKTLAPIYLINSDEILLVQEASDAIRAAARKADYVERISLSVDPGSDWGKALHTEAHSLSLFASKRIVELNLAASKPNAAASKILQAIAENPPIDIVLIITSNKLDSKAEQTAWYKALEKKGVAIQIWPITLEQLPPWLIQRAKKSGLTLTLDAAKFLAQQVEGNLLAAAQEIEKLSLLQTSEAVDLLAIQQTVTDNARFDIFSLVECSLSGNSVRSLRILETLRAEDTEPLLVLWALTREIRMLAGIAQQAKQGAALNSLFTKFRIWEKRQPGVRRFLKDHPLSSTWQLLNHAAKIDRLIKGSGEGNVWTELEELALKMAGSVIIKTS